MSCAGLHGKLTGAGGGGFMFSLVPPSMSEESLARARMFFSTSAVLDNMSLYQVMMMLMIMTS